MHIQPHTKESEELPIPERQTTYHITFRHRVRLAAEFALVLLVVIVPVFFQAGVLPSLQTAISSAAPYEPLVAVPDRAEANVLQHQGGPTETGPQGGGDFLVTEGVLVSTGPAGADEVATSRVTNGEISVYTVRPGDSLSQIAEMYDVTTNTVLWANDLDSATDIRPGDTLIILPIAGVQHTVKSGDTLKKLASTYEGDVDEILAYNQLASANDLEAGMDIVIPGGRIEQEAPAPQATAQAPQPVQRSGSVSSSGGFNHPLPGSIRTQGMHGYNAVDFAASVGAPIRAAAAGEVIVSRNSGWNGGYGIYVVVRHPNGTQTLYAHNSRNAVGVGAYVEAGQTIAYVGNSGRSTGPHLHFEVRGGTNPF